MASPTAPPSKQPTICWGLSMGRTELQAPSHGDVVGARGGLLVGRDSSSLRGDGGCQSCMRTYSNSVGRPSMPLFGGAIQLANFPGS